MKQTTLKILHDHPAPESSFKLSTASIRARCKPPTLGEVSATGKPIRQRVYWDQEVPGFGILVRPPAQERGAGDQLQLHSPPRGRGEGSQGHDWSLRALDG